MRELRYLNNSFLPSQREAARGRKDMVIARQVCPAAQWAKQPEPRFTCRKAEQVRQVGVSPCVLKWE